MEAAGWTHSLANVVIVAVDIGQLGTAFGADAQVVNKVFTGHSIAGQTVNTEVDPGIFRRNTAADQIVGIKDHGSPGGDITGENVCDIGGVGVAHDGVTGQVGDDDKAGLDIGIDAGTGAFVYLQHSQIIRAHPA